MSLKDNFNQAVKEILRKDGLVGEELSKESKKKSELDKYIDPPKPESDRFEQFTAEQPAEETAEPDIAPAAEASDFGAAEPQSTPEPARNPFAQASQPQAASQFGAAARPPYEQQAQNAPRGAFAPQQGGGDPFARMGGYNAGAGYGAGYGGGVGYGGGAVPPVPPVNAGSAGFMGNNPDTPYYETEETTVISRNTIVNGSIRSFANVNVDGSIKGDVKITKNISVTGKIVGDIECNNSVMAGASMQGNVASKGQVQIDRDTIILGDISAQYLDLNGKIKGNLDIGGKAEFKTDAVVLGNITASTITVLDGATIQGYVNTTFLQESSSSIFPEAIAVTE